MKSQPLVSIIVPVYNAAPYLHRCIDSILVQSLSDYELLLIDDGSTDDSGKICDEYAAGDARIRVFHQVNIGVAKTRRFGFEQSEGKYVATVDSDDWADSDYLANMVETADRNDADMVMCAYWEYATEDKYISNKPTEDNPMTWAVDALEGRCHAGLWNKLIKREILLSPSVLRPQYSYYEDMVTMLSCLRQCRTIVYDDRAAYHYRVNMSSLTNAGEIGHRMRMYEELMKNLTDVGMQYGYPDNSELKRALWHRANMEKARLIKATPKGESVNRRLLTSYFPKSYRIIKVKGFTTLFRYLAIRGFCLPYRLLLRERR